MALNKLALLRYKVIDKCLQNHYRKWTLENLINAVSDALYEYEGIKSGVSKRTIQLDIQTLRSDKLGYNAPIIVVERKFYTYSDPTYSITNNNVSKQDIEKLAEVVKLLGQFKSFNYFEDMSAIIGRLEDKIYRHGKSKETYIDFEKNELLKGLEWIDPLLKAVKNKQVLEITYQSFKAKKPSTNIAYPYLLKEYRNRWFLLCRGHKHGMVQLQALDRMHEVKVVDNLPFIPAKDFDVAHFFDNVIGVTKSLKQVTNKVILQFGSANAPYVLTKPLHSSQQILKNEKNELIISIEVVLNFELEREILGFGEDVKVLAPRLLQKKIARRLAVAAERYSSSGT